MLRSTLGLAAAGSLAVLSGCGPSYSPNTYDAAAVQQANAVQRGVVIGVRAVKVSADAAVGTVTGAAAGGIAGSTVGDSGPVKALSALGGSLVGGLVGSGVQHAQGDTNAFEYIVRESNNNLVSVTQRDKASLRIGERVLVIAGRQARIVADYTLSPPNSAPSDLAPGATPRPSTAPSEAGTVTAAPHAAATPVGASAQNPGPAPGGAAAAQTVSAKSPSSSSAAAAGGGTPASAETAAAVAAVLATPSGNLGDPASAAAEPGKPVPLGGTVVVPGAATAGAPAAAGGGTTASSAGGKANAPNPP